MTYYPRGSGTWTNTSTLRQIVAIAREDLTNIEHKCLRRLENGSGSLVKVWQWGLASGCGEDGGRNGYVHAIRQVVDFDECAF